MSPIMDALSRWFGNLFFSNLPAELQMGIGSEFLHLGGNIIFLIGIVACNILFAFQLRRARIAMYLQSFHTYEHIMRTATILTLHRSIGLSTLFGLSMPTPISTGYLLYFHFTFNLIPMLFLVSAIRQHNQSLIDNPPRHSVQRIAILVLRGVQSVGQFARTYRMWLVALLLCAIVLFALKEYADSRGLKGLAEPEKIVAECANRQDRELCYMLRLQQSSGNRMTTGELFAQIREVQGLDPWYTDARCSGVAYMIGQSVVIRSPGMWAGAFSSAPYGICSDGYTYGLVSGHFGTIASAQELADAVPDLRSICGVKVQGAEATNCFRSLGHALALSANNADTVAVLCTNIADTAAARSACATGAREMTIDMRGMMMQ
jgi:hypothetical protein